MKSMKKLRQLAGKRVLVRVDFNVPIEKKKVLDHTRLLASLPTIEFLIEQRAKVILVTHIGRPAGKVVSSLKVDPVAAHLGIMLGKSVKKIDTRDWSFGARTDRRIRDEIHAMRPAQVAILENIRFAPEEEINDPEFAERLAGLADLYVLDGFGVAHRTAASVVGVATHLPSYAGLLLEKELKGLNRLLKRPKHPYLLMIGGAKTQTKLPIIKHLLPKLDHIIIGGTIFNTYAWAKGYRVGDSTVDKKMKEQALRLCSKRKVIKPVDVVVGDPAGTSYRVVHVGKRPHRICNKDEMILDVGPASLAAMQSYIGTARTLVFNGAFGLIEQPPYDAGSTAMTRMAAKAGSEKAYVVAGGGETTQLISALALQHSIDLLSTGGGAMLQYLSGKALPGVSALG